jgi:hypothetical protein
LLDQQADTDADQVRVIARDLSRRFEDGATRVVMDAHPLQIEAMAEVNGLAELGAGQGPDAID